MDWDFMGALIRLIILLPLVLGLAYVAIRYGMGNIGHALRGGSSAMAVVDRLSLGPKSSLVVVRVAEKYYLLAHGEGQTTMLSEMQDFPEKDFGMDREKEKRFLPENLISRIRRKK